MFVDCRPGKFPHLTRSGIYVGDDLLPQLTWPSDHQPRVDTVIADIATPPGLPVTLMSWSSGLVLAART